MTAERSPAYDLYLAGLNYILTWKNYEEMDAALANSKNKRGAFMKYLHCIPPLAFNEDPYATLGSTSVEDSYWAAAVGIGELMLERLRAFGKLHGIEEPVRSK